MKRGTVNRGFHTMLFLSTAWQQGVKEVFIKAPFSKQYCEHPPRGPHGIRLAVLGHIFGPQTC